MLTAPQSFTTADLRTIPFLMLADELPWIVTGFDLDEDGDTFAFASLHRGDGQPELLLSTGPDGLMLHDCRTLAVVGGPFDDGHQAAMRARNALMNPEATVGAAQDA